MYVEALLNQNIETITTANQNDGKYHRELMRAQNKILLANCLKRGKTEWKTKIKREKRVRKKRLVLILHFDWLRVSREFSRQL